MKGKVFERCFGMGCIVISYGIAAFNGYNGMLFTSVVTILGSIIVGGVAYQAGRKGVNGKVHDVYNGEIS
jgi:hypothetical protein